MKSTSCAREWAREAHDVSVCGLGIEDPYARRCIE